MSIFYITLLCYNQSIMTNKKTRSVTKGIIKKTELFIGKANKKADKTVKTLKKEWKKEKPQREEYKEKLKNAVNRALEDGIKIGGDVLKTIEKDINEINGRNKNKK